MRLAQPRFAVTLLASLTAASLSACALLPSGGNPQPVQQTAAATTPLPPTATEIPAPTPTATPMPIEFVHQGERDLRNGDWDSAATSFQQVLANAGASDDERIAAQIGLAHASLRQGDFAAARGALDAFLEEFPQHERAAQAYFLRGEAQSGLEAWDEAIADYEAYLSLHPGPIDSYVYERIADAHLAAGRAPDAIAAYDQALQGDRNTVAKLALREKVATINRQLGNTGAAVAQYQAILDTAENYAYRAGIELSLGQTWLEAGEVDAAYAQFERVFMEYPQSFEALSALRALLEAGWDVDQYQRGLVNYYQGQYDIAVQAFLAHLAALDSVLDDVPVTHLYIADSYRQLGNLQAAMSELQGTINRFTVEDGESWAQAWLDLADVYAAMGNPESAYSTIEAFLESYGDLPQAPDALALAGQIAEDSGDSALASEYYRRLATDYPQDERAAEGLYEAGVAAYQNQDFDLAADLFTTTADLPAGEPAASHLWLAKVQQADGAAEATTAELETAAALDPAGYYGLRAQDIAAGREPFWEAPGFTLPEDTDAGRAEAEQWVVQQFGLDVEPPLADTLRGDVAADPRMVRARELWDLGLVSEARTDFEEVRTAFQDDPLAMYQLAIYFREIGLYRSSILCAARLHRLAGIDPLDGPAFLARLRYPTYFEDLVLDYSAQYDLDPLFVFALIEQESLFEGFATSSAAAQGLMQIWPPTGEDIATQLNWPDYSASDLQRPVVNVAFGTWLLRDELNRFDGDPYAVLAAYNAGSGRALEWQVQSGGDPDLYVELVSLDEPQSYIQLIYEHYAAYRALYGTTE